MREGVVGRVGAGGGVSAARAALSRSAQHSTLRLAGSGGAPAAPAATQRRFAGSPAQPRHCTAGPTLPQPQPCPAPPAAPALTPLHDGDVHGQQVDGGEVLQLVLHAQRAQHGAHLQLERRQLGGLGGGTGRWQGGGRARDGAGGVACQAGCGGAAERTIACPATQQSHVASTTRQRSCDHTDTVRPAPASRHNSRAAPWRQHQPAPRRAAPAAAPARPPARGPQCRRAGRCRAAARPAPPASQTAPAAPPAAPGCTARPARRSRGGGGRAAGRRVGTPHAMKGARAAGRWAHGACSGAGLPGECSRAARGTQATSPSPRSTAAGALKARAASRPARAWNTPCRSSSTKRPTRCAKPSQCVACRGGKRGGRGRGRAAAQPTDRPPPASRGRRSLASPQRAPRSRAATPHANQHTPACQPPRGAPTARPWPTAWWSGSARQTGARGAQSPPGTAPSRGRGGRQTWGGGRGGGRARAGPARQAGSCFVSLHWAAMG